jgi:hypothetical protein
MKTPISLPLVSATVIPTASTPARACWRVTRYEPDDRCRDHSRTLPPPDSKARRPRVDSPAAAAPLSALDQPERLLLRLGHELWSLLLRRRAANRAASSAAPAPSSCLRYRLILSVLCPTRRASFALD